MSPRKQGSCVEQPRSMNEKLKQLIGNTRIEGATPSTFRDSYIKAMFEAGCQYKELMLITGIKQKKTLDRKIKPKQLEIEQVYKKVFCHIKVPN